MHTSTVYGAAEVVELKIRILPILSDEVNGWYGKENNTSRKTTDRKTDRNEIV
jgi:hypothetical protein